MTAIMMQAMAVRLDECLKPSGSDRLASLALVSALTYVRMEWWLRLKMDGEMMEAI